jgi:hypothetical protein
MDRSFMPPQSRLKEKKQNPNIKTPSQAVASFKVGAVPFNRDSGTLYEVTDPSKVAAPLKTRSRLLQGLQLMPLDSREDGGTPGQRLDSNRKQVPKERMAVPLSKDRTAASTQKL